MKKAKQKLEAVRAEEHKEDSATLAMLSRRIKTVTEKVELGGGDEIEVWACLSQQEVDEIVRLDATITKGKDPVKAKKSYHTIIEKITVDPLLTAQWLEENPDAFSPQDLRIIYQAYLKLLDKRAEKIVKAQKFLAD